MSFFGGPTGQASGLKGTGYKEITSPTQNTNQSQLTSMLHSLLGGQGGGFSQGLGQLGKLAGGDQEAFGQMEAPAMRQFGALQGNLASRFSGMGGSGARKSSGFQNTMSGAAGDFAERLQGQRLGIQQNALQQLLGLSEGLLNRPTFQSGFVQKQKPFWQQLLTSGAGGAGSLASGAGNLGLAKWMGLF